MGRLVPLWTALFPCATKGSCFSGDIFPKIVTVRPSPTVRGILLQYEKVYPWQKARNEPNI